MAQMNEKNVVIPYKPRPLQLDIHLQLEAHRWAVLVIHRRFGKTFMLLNHMIKDALLCDKPNPRYAYVAPFLKQAKQLAWDYLKFLCDPIPERKFSESELSVKFPNGAVIRLFGADNPDAMRGLYLDGAVLDEYAQIVPTIFSSIIRPALSDRYGWCIFSGTPNGKNHFFDILNKAKGSEDWFWCVLKASETGIVPQEELDSARETMTDEEYEREYECSFDSIIGKKIYPEFNIHTHVSANSLLPRQATKIYRGWDNTGLSPAVVLSRLSPIGQWLIFKEFCFEDTGVAEAAEAVILWCNSHLPPGCTFRDIGDPGGRIRDTNKSCARDYIIRKSQELGAAIFIEDGIQTWKVRRESVANRLNKLRNGKPSLLIDSSCEILVEGFLGGYAYKELANLPGMYSQEAIKNKYSHPHDAVQYLATRLFEWQESDFNDHDEFMAENEEEFEMFTPNFSGQSVITGY